MESAGAVFRVTTAVVTRTGRVSAGPAGAARVAALAVTGLLAARAGPPACAVVKGRAVSPSAPASAQPSAMFLERMATPFLGSPSGKGSKSIIQNVRR